MRGIPELLLIIIIIAGYGGALFKAKSWPLQTSLFPFIVSGIGISLAITQLIIFFTKAKEVESDDSRKTQSKNKTALLTIGWILGFFFSTALLGFQWGLPVIIFLYLKISGKEKLFLAILLAGTSWVILYGLKTFLNLPLHSGFWFKWF